VIDDERDERRAMSAIDVDAALARARQHGLDRFDAQALLAEVLRRPRSWLLAHGDASLADDEAARFAAALERRAAGEPLAYLRGRQEFYGLDLAVSPAVLVPRADTETLVDWALDVLAGLDDPAVLDLGTGSGAIALAVARHAPQARVSAVDASADALAVARANGRALGLDVRWHLGYWFDALDPAARFDLIVANPPYIAEGDPHLAALSHEPAMALTSGADGLDAIRSIAAAAPDWLVRGGRLLLEHGHDQGEAVAGLLSAAGFVDVMLRRDLAGLPRCTGGLRPC
jgi:release factor glutamine methyltransferase